MISVIHCSSAYPHRPKENVLKPSYSIEYKDYWCSAFEKITNQHLTFDLSKQCVVQKLCLYFSWSYKTFKWCPKHFEIQIPLKNSKIISEKNELTNILKNENQNQNSNWKSVETFENLKTQQQIGKKKFAEFEFSKPIKTRFIRIFIKNNLGDDDYICIGRVKFE